MLERASIINHTEIRRAGGHAADASGLTVSVINSVTPSSAATEAMSTGMPYQVDDSSLRQFHRSAAK